MGLRSVRWMGRGWPPCGSHSSPEVAPPPTPLSSRRAAAGADWALLTPDEALATLRAGDVAIGRLDVLPTLDGVDEGLWVLGALEARGVTVLNGAPFLLAAHDKLLTARLLRARRAAAPANAADRRRPARVAAAGAGRDQAAVRELGARRRALRRQGVPRRSPGRAARRAVVSRARRDRAELVPPLGFDLRVVVAGGVPVGAISRVAAPGEWRTNVALGAERRSTTPPADACALALAAARATGAALVGVDLLPDGLGGWTVVEINGAVEFNMEYALRPGADPFAETAFRLDRGGDVR